MNLSHTSSRPRQKRLPQHSPNNFTPAAFDTAQKSLAHLQVFSEAVQDRRLQQALLASQRRIQELEMDRDRMQCDLHDGVLQSLYAVGLGLESCGILLQDAPSQVTDQLKHSTTQLDQALRELRLLLKHDRGKETDAEEDLDRALHSLIETMNGLSSVRCRLNLDPAATARMTRPQRRQVLNFAREALSNCIRHAHASAVEVSLTVKHGIPCLEISDDGIGFSPAHPPKLGLGLRSLTARASALGGRVDIASRPLQGTRVVLNLPKP